MRSELGASADMGYGEISFDRGRRNFLGDGFEDYNYPSSLKVYAYKPGYPIIATAIVAGIIISSCSGGKSVDQAVTEYNATQETATLVVPPVTQEVSPTVQRTTIPTVQPTVEVIQENRLEPVPVEDLYNNDFAFEYNQRHSKAGYFVGLPELESQDTYLFIDFSYSGEMRIVEATELDQHSWGVYTERVSYQRDPVLPPAMGIRDAITDQVRDGDGKITVVWGNLAPGTSIFFSNDMIAGIARELKVSKENAMKRILPMNDSRFRCENVPYITNADGSAKGTAPGVLCTRE
jgi:hypothetical protein